MKTSSKVLIGGVVALAVVLFVVLGLRKEVATTPASETPAVGYVQSDNGRFPEGAQIGDSGIRYVNFTMPAGSNQVAYRNTSGRDQYVALPFLRTTGTASSTYRILVGTSTSATIANYTAVNLTTTGSLISALLATSTVATTTSSVESAYVNRLMGVVRLVDGAYLNIALIQGFPTPSPLCTGSVCETATSTNRGFNITGLLHIYQPNSY